MVKGLLYRQIIAGAQILLVALLAIAVFALIRELLTGVPRVEVGGAEPPNPEQLEERLPKIRSRTAYAAIVDSGLFGDAGRFDPGSKVEPVTQAPPPTDEPDTKLALKLKGTTFTEPRDPRASAIIEVREKGNSTDAYFIGDEVIPQVFLLEVRSGEVLLDNRRLGAREKLRREERLTLATAPVVRNSVRLPSSPPRSQNPDMIYFKRDEIAKKLNDEWARLSATIDIKVVKNEETGEVHGLTTDNIESVEVAKEMGLKNGDVLVSINNEKVDSADKVKTILEKYRNARTFRVGVLRSGQVKYLTYRLQ